MEESVCRYLSWRAEEEELIMSEASFKAREAFCSPSASITFALACLVASASAAMALCNCCGKRTSFTSTLSTLIPQGSVALSRCSRMFLAISSLSANISCRVLVPSVFLSVVDASSLVEWDALLTLHTEDMGL